VGLQKSLIFFNKFYRDLFIYLFIYWVKKNKHLSMKQGNLFVCFVLFCFVLVRSTEPGCFRLFLVSLESS
jgi:hypothetical protein